MYRRFKKEIKEIANKLAIKYLQNLKSKHSKTENIPFNKLKAAEYLKDKKIRPDQAKFIFKMRTRMYPVKCNFKNQYQKNLLCDLCKIEEDSQEHLLKCKVLEHFVPEIKETEIAYKDIFGTIEKMIPASRLLLKFCKEREYLLNSHNQLRYLFLLNGP